MGAILRLSRRGGRLSDAGATDSQKNVRTERFMSFFMMKRVGAAWLKNKNCKNLHDFN
jgi:hypothetical protein